MDDCDRSIFLKLLVSDAQLEDQSEDAAKGTEFLELLQGAEAQGWMI
eukprot:CAMPEP_0179072046 /NCGR_PEP_ID=MMETSP0796-20121207/31848_1 /TAXON_ID=73915 /ORGANISM="Pyrodinium bahamense, Strain pbaha01" /LENGTH=46 /DNA_ID= /DNA_START= /DNA_END= /DNA_ORIENTATION=